MKETAIIIPTKGEPKANNQRKIDRARNRFVSRRNQTTESITQQIIAERAGVVINKTIKTARMTAFEQDVSERDFPKRYVYFIRDG